MRNIPYVKVIFSLWVVSQIYPAFALDASSTGPGEIAPEFKFIPLMIALPNSSFDMGSNKTSYKDELPIHRLKVARLAMGMTEISFAQWDACFNDKNHPLHCTYSPKHIKGRGNLPVVNVSYNDITQQYLPWLNAKVGFTAPNHFRLPTEVEWEYAAKAGGHGEFSFGPRNNDKIDPSRANYDASYAYKGSSTSLASTGTMPVNSFEPNAWGLYNMHGNVWEWTYDCYNTTDYQKRKNALGEWQALKQSDLHFFGCNRTARGGSWVNLPINLRSANRFEVSDNSGRFSIMGFRVARTF